MSRTRRGMVAVLGAGLFACAEPGAETEVGVAVQALDACTETVPANRNIDGIPSYAQCAASENSAIFSNNGINTSLTSMGSDWVKTQYSGGYQCTELAHRYLYFKWNVKWIPNGNAGQWCDTQPPASSGVMQTMTPVHGDIMVLANGSCGASASTGHVTVVDIVDAATSKLTVVEQNGARRGTYMASCAKCFLHVMANNGTAPPAAGAPAQATAGAAAPTTMAGARAPTMRPMNPNPSTPGTMPPATDPISMAGRPSFPTMTPPVVTAGAPAVATTPLTTAGAAATTNVGVPNRNVQTANDGCSVGTPGGAHGASTALAWIAALLLGLVTRRRQLRTR